MQGASGAQMLGWEQISQCYDNPIRSRVAVQRNSLLPDLIYMALSLQ
jgi:hypothetical protein